MLKMLFAVVAIFALMTGKCMVFSESDIKNAQPTLIGTWNLESSENFDEYMKELGVGYFTRMAAALIKSTVVISNDGPKWLIQLLSSLKNSQINFEDGVEFNESGMDGNDYKSTITISSPTRLVHVQRKPDSGDVATTVVREIIGDKLVTTMVAGNVKCVRTYTRTA